MSDPVNNWLKTISLIAGSPSASPSASELPGWQMERLATLLEALGDPEVSFSELASLTWISGQELATIENLAAVIRRAIDNRRSDQ